MKTVSCKIPAGMGSKLEAAAAERDVFRSELLRAAIRHYVATNPDGYSAFERDSRGQVRIEKGPCSARHEGESDRFSDGGLYDPTEGSDS
jgi:hypothetical protein